MLRKETNSWVRRAYSLKMVGERETLRSGEVVLISFLILAARHILVKREEISWVQDRRYPVANNREIGFQGNAGYLATNAVENQRGRSDLGNSTKSYCVIYQLVDPTPTNVRARGHTANPEKQASVMSLLILSPKHLHLDLIAVLKVGERVDFSTFLETFNLRHDDSVVVETNCESHWASDCRVVYQPFWQSVSAMYVLELQSVLCDRSA